MKLNTDCKFLRAGRLLLAGGLLCVLTVPDLRAQESTFGPCRQPVTWEQVSLVDEIPEDLEKMLLVTNRMDNSQSGDPILFPNEVEEYRYVTYLWAACDEGNWLLAPAKSFEEGIHGVDQGKDLLVFVHGHGKSMPLVLTRARQMQALYKVTMVIFDWPSYNSNFNKSLSRVRRCGENFYNLVLQLDEYRRAHMAADQGMSLFLHSLGNYFLSHMVVNGNNQYLDEVIFDNIILNAAAIRSKEHGEVLSQLKFQKRIYVVSNENDRVLRGAHLLTSGRMLGNLPMEPLAPNTIYMDFTPLVGWEHTYFAGYHEFEVKHAVFAHFFNSALAGKEVDLDAPYYLKAPDRKVYTVRE